jgi:DUF917 family protein
MTGRRRAGITRLDDLTCERAVLGGAVLGGGGGGTLEAGLRLGQLTVSLGDASLVELDDLPPEADLVAIATLSSAGPGEHQYRPLHHKRAIELLATNTGAEFTGLVNCGSGAEDTMVGWAQSALLGIPLIDAVVDPGLHPLAVTALAELWSEAGVPISLSAVGYRRQGDQCLELYARGASCPLIHMLQQDANGSWEDLALACGPLSQQWLREHGHPKLLSHTIDIGTAIMEIEDDNGYLIAGALGRMLGGQLITSASITDITWHGTARREYGIVAASDRHNRKSELVFLDRYVALDVDGSRVATFPDLLVMLGIKGTPLSGRELSRGQDVHILMVPSRQLTPQMTARLEAVYCELENITGKSMCLPPVAESLFASDRGKEVTTIDLS